VSASDYEQLMAFWRVYAPAADEIGRATRVAALAIPEFAAIVPSTPTPEEEARRVRSRAALRTAFEDRDWGPHFAEMEEMGRTYASAGISLRSWYELTNAFRGLVTAHLAMELASEPAVLAKAIEGLDLYQKVSLARLASAYLDAA